MEIVKMFNVAVLITAIICVFPYIQAHVADHNFASNRHQSEEEKDHDMFLGKDLSDELDGLSIDQVITRLGEIFDKIDTSGDKLLDKQELVEWMRKITTKYVTEETERFWNEHGVPEGQNMSWDAYVKSYKEEETESDSEFINKMLEKDLVRWNAADLDKDGNLSLEEMKAFIHPEEFDHTRPSVSQELHDSIDLDKDGFISEEEYLQDMGFSKDDKTQVDSINSEKEIFHTKRDKNHDGKLDMEEFTEWIAPHPETFAREEAEHLISEADDNKDGFISKEEMEKHHHTFSGSQVTDYGDILKRGHDEL